MMPQYTAEVWWSCQSEADPKLELGPTTIALLFLSNKTKGPEPSLPRYSSTESFCHLRSTDTIKQE